MICLMMRVTSGLISHSFSHQRHEYRNGIIKTVYADGTQETRYPSGRLRIKDKHENVIVDSMVRTTDQLGLVS